MAEPRRHTRRRRLEGGAYISGYRLWQWLLPIPAARILGRNGKVYGLDVDAEAIRELKEKAAREGLKNLYFL